MSKISIFLRNMRQMATVLASNNRGSQSLFGIVASAATLMSAFAASVQAESTQVENKAFVFAQSKDVELPEDFLVRVEGNKLQVALESLGIIDAKRPTSNLLVRLLDSSGAEKTATTNAQGIAEFTDVKEDELHAVVVADKNSHGVIPLMTVSDQKATEKGIVSTRIRLPIMEANHKEILASINKDIIPGNVAGDSFYGVDDFNIQGLNLYRVRLQTDGTLLGRVIVVDRELAEKLRYAKLTFFRNNEVVARTDSNTSDGSFYVNGLETGIHGVVAAGPAGYAAFAFDILPPKVAPDQPGESVLGLPVSFVEANPSEKLYVFLVPPKLVPQVVERVREVYTQSPLESDSEAQPLAMQPGMNGGFGGGFGGGGGGSGGGGLMGGGGGMSGLAGLAAIAAVVANNDSNSSNNNTVVSPIVVVSQ